MMMTTKTVLILTRENDAHAPPIEEALRRRGMVCVRFDLADFPARVVLRATHHDTNIAINGSGGERGTWGGQLVIGTHTVALEDIVSVWWGDLAATLHLPPMQRHYAPSLSRKPLAACSAY